MQVDLHNQGYEWYAFTSDNGSMVSFETVSDTMVTDPVTGLGESPVLQPLKQFGFNIYSDPGPPQPSFFPAPAREHQAMKPHGR